MTNALMELAGLLAACKEKIACYHKETKGEYPGGPVLQDLNPRIDKAISQLRTAASGVGEAVYQYRFRHKTKKHWSPWQEAPSEKAAMEYAEMYASDGLVSEQRTLYPHPGAEARDAERVTNIAGFSYPSLDGMLCDALPDGNSWQFLSAHVRKVNGALQIDELIIRSEATGPKSLGTEKSEG